MDLDRVAVNGGNHDDLHALSDEIIDLVNLLGDFEGRVPRQELVALAVDGVGNLLVQDHVKVVVHGHVGSSDETLLVEPRMIKNEQEGTDNGGQPNCRVAQQLHPNSIMLFHHFLFSFLSYNCASL